MNLRWKSNSFIKDVLTLVSGTAIAQAIPVLISPVITRLYTPEQFGIFNQFIAIVTVLAILVTLRYEATIVLPKRDDDAKKLLRATICISFFLCLILLFILAFSASQLASIIDAPMMEHWLYWVPFACLLQSSFQSLTYWYIRKKDFKRIASAKVFQSIGLSVTQLASGFAQASNAGLIFGYIIGQLIAVTLMIKHTRLFQRDYFSYWKRTRYLLWRYRDFPIFNAIPTVLNIFASNAPIFFIAHTYNVTQAGLYALAYRILAAPMSLVSTAIGNVYYQRITEIYKSKPHSLRTEVVETSKKLVCLSMVVFAPFMIFGEELFGIIFGKAWKDAGTIAQLLSISLSIRFVVSPLTSIFGLTNNNRLGAFWKTSYFLGIVFTLSFFNDYEFKTYLIVIVVIDCLLYLFGYLMVLYSSSKLRVL